MPRPAPAGLYLHELRGSWSGDSLRLAGVLAAYAGTTNTYHGGAVAREPTHSFHAAPGDGQRLRPRLPRPEGNQSIATARRSPQRHTERVPRCARKFRGAYCNAVCRAKWCRWARNGVCGGRSDDDNNCARRCACSGVESQQRCVPRPRGDGGPVPGFRLVGDAARSCGLLVAQPAHDGRHRACPMPESDVPLVGTGANPALQRRVSAEPRPAPAAPRALGARGREFWTDVWAAIGPQIEQVMTTGEATWHEDQYLPIERNGRLEDCWWTYSYSPVLDDDGRINGTLVVCQETTSRIPAGRGEVERFLAESERARSEAVRPGRGRDRQPRQGRVPGRDVGHELPDALQRHWRLCGPDGDGASRASDRTAAG